MNTPLPGPPLRIAVLGDFDSIHTRRWLDVFVARGHEVHAISYYRPAAEVPGVTLHVISSAEAPSRATDEPSSAARLLSMAPRSLLRLGHALRYRRAGLKPLLAEMRPDVFHAHYVTEHGFYGALAGYHPYVVSAWGSDLLRDSRTPAGRLLAGWTLAKADLVTTNDEEMSRRARQLAVPAERLALVRLGIDRHFLEKRSVNEMPPHAAPPTIVSTRALEPLYNIDTVLKAFAQTQIRVPAARLVVAGDGSLRARLESLADELQLGHSISFVGHLNPTTLRDALAAAHVYVSVPASDSLSVSTLEAMAAGPLPVVADLPSLDGWLGHRHNALLVPPSPRIEVLANALTQALGDGDLRRRAVATNRARVEAEGLHEANMLQMERHYYRLSGYSDL